MLELNKVHLGDCRDLMKELPSNSIDLLIGDLPFGMTKNPWDVAMDPRDLWPDFVRVAKPNAAILLFGQGIFAAKLKMTNPRMYRYEWIWEKTHSTGMLNAKKMPMKCHEEVVVFYNNLPTYNPQKTTGHPRKVSTAHHKRNSKKTENYGEHDFASYDSTERYPRSVLKFKSDRQKSALNSTQKPVALIEYFIRTYSNEGDLVLDPTAGSGTTGVACGNLGRDFILMEKDECEFEKCSRRLAQ